MGLTGEEGLGYPLYCWEDTVCMSFQPVPGSLTAKTNGPRDEGFVSAMVLMYTSRETRASFRVSSFHNSVQWNDLTNLGSLACRGSSGEKWPPRETASVPRVESITAPFWRYTITSRGVSVSFALQRLALDLNKSFCDNHCTAYYS